MGRDLESFEQDAAEDVGSEKGVYAGEVGSEKSTDARTSRGGNRNREGFSALPYNCWRFTKDFVKAPDIMPSHKMQG